MHLPEKLHSWHIYWDTLFKEHTSYSWDNLNCRLASFENYDDVSNQVFTWLKPILIQFVSSVSVSSTEVQTMLWSVLSSVSIKVTSVTCISYVSSLCLSSTSSCVSRWSLEPSISGSAHNNRTEPLWYVNMHCQFFLPEAWLWGDCHQQLSVWQH